MTNEYTNERYNSALRNKMNIPKSIIDPKVYRFGKMTVFQHDICSGMCEEFMKAGVIYSELSYPNGYERFTRETQAEGSSYSNYLDGLAYVIGVLKVPTFLVIGNYSSAYLKPHRVKPIKFQIHNADTLCIVYNYEDKLEFTSEIECREFVCRSFDNILDPCCGFGIIAKTALNYGRRVILSDINSACIYYIFGRYGAIYEQGKANNCNQETA